MSKKSFRGKPKKKSTGRVNPNDMMSQFTQMQTQMAETQDKLSQETFAITAAGGLLQVEINGTQRLTSLKIDNELIDEDDPDLLTDLLVATINQAIEKSQTVAAEKMEGVTGGMGMGDLLGGLGI